MELMPRLSNLVILCLARRGWRLCSQDMPSSVTTVLLLASRSIPILRSMATRQVGDQDHPGARHSPTSVARMKSHIYTVDRSARGSTTCHMGPFGECVRSLKPKRPLISRNRSEPGLVCVSTPCGDGIHPLEALCAAGHTWRVLCLKYSNGAQIWNRFGGKCI